MSATRLTILLLFLSATSAFAKSAFSVSSPDKKITFTLGKDASGVFYQVSYKGDLLVDKSHLSLSFKQGGEFGKGITFGKSSFKKMEETYNLVIGKISHVHSLSNELIVPIIENSGLKRQVNIEIRVFNDGVAFRYVIPGKDE
ncbi:MAG: glycoside hydrolase family 97 N-terminal domain-containing protein [Mucilaginibacter sp.]|nr:glycoside hydrolase family 97 N-terminal domain-containing protein [Mucilaginibacter sp.]